MRKNDYEFPKGFFWVGFGRGLRCIMERWGWLDRPSFL